MKGYSAFPKAPIFSGTSSFNCLVFYSDTRCGGSLTSLGRGGVSVFCSPGWLCHPGYSFWGVLPLWRNCSQCILQPKPTGPPRTLAGVVSSLCRDLVSVFLQFQLTGLPRTLIAGVLPLCWHTVSVFCSPSWLGHLGPSLGVSFPLWRNAVSVFCSPSWLGPSRALIGWVLPLCRDAISGFCSPSWLGHPGHSLGVSFPSEEMQSVYSAVPADWAKLRLNCFGYLIKVRQTGRNQNIVNLLTYLSRKKKGANNQFFSGLNTDP